MGIIDKLSNKKTKITNSNHPTDGYGNILSSKDSLGGEEIAVILNLIKKSSFNGEDIETIYNLVIKLQNQYTKLEN